MIIYYSILIVEVMFLVKLIKMEFYMYFFFIMVLMYLMLNVKVNCVEEREKKILV